MKEKLTGWPGWRIDDFEVAQPDSLRGTAK
jgi:hypothetical protein